jgi:DNA-binding NarL/FixJ family response regulator
MLVVENHIFVTASRVPPARWRQALPWSQIVSVLPAVVPDGCIVWLHNMTPAQLPAGKRPAGAYHFVVVYDEPSDEAGLDALAQGASGYCNAHATPELLRTIAFVVRNAGLWVGESLLNRMIGAISSRAPMAGRQHEHRALDSLTVREREVALCVARGENNKEIARQLHLAERTVKAHLTGIFDKFGVHDRLRLALLLNNSDEYTAPIGHVSLPYALQGNCALDRTA